MSRKLRLRHPAAFVVAAVAAVAAVALFAGGASAVVAGAGFTTNDPNYDGSGTCLNGNSDPNPAVNCNLYSSKNYVWTNGGPSNGKNELSAGTYFFAVLDPGGQKNPNDGTPGNLSDVSPTTNTPGGDSYLNREFTVDSSGKIATYLGGGHLTDSHYQSGGNGLFINLMPYDDTTNPGGVYIMAVCQLSGDPATTPIVGTVVPSDCKYDAFKAPTSTCVGPDCVPTDFGAISGLKYYDSNGNGNFDSGDVPIPGWKIDYQDGLSDTLTTDSTGQFSVILSGDTYFFGEEHPTNTTGAPFNLPLWVQTGNTDGNNQTNPTGGDAASLSNFIYTVTHTDTGSTSGLNFGNVCLGTNGTGLTIGYWMNHVPQTATWYGNWTDSYVGDSSGVNTLHPRTATGAQITLSKTNLKTWLQAANATNMAYMLSAQSVGMQFNILSGKTSSSSLVYAPLLIPFLTKAGFDTTGLSSTGFITIHNLLVLASNTLLAHGNTTPSGDLRNYQEAIKTALDSANNNVSFIQQPPSPGQLPACANTTITGWTPASFPQP